MSALPPSLPEAVPEIERRMRWRLLPTIVFIALLVLLLVIALVALFTRPEHPSGLPDDAAVARARALVSEGVFVTVRDLRFRAAILGGEAHDELAVTDVPGRVARARAARTDRRRGVRDPRLDAALGTLALAQHDYRLAEREFRRSIEAAPHYGEGRLGLGVTLALRADVTPELAVARARLQAIAQFAAVDAGDIAYPHAVYDRAVQLAHVGRASDARRFAAEYFRLDEGGEWAKRLAGEIAGVPAARGETPGAPAAATRP